MRDSLICRIKLYELIVLSRPASWGKPRAVCSEQPSWQSVFVLRRRRWVSWGSAVGQSLAFQAVSIPCRSAIVPARELKQNVTAGLPIVAKCSPPHLVSRRSHLGRRHVRVTHTSPIYIVVPTISLDLLPGSEYPQLTPTLISDRGPVT
jgi:hypothetical protein